MKLLLPFLLLAATLSAQTSPNPRYVKAMESALAGMDSLQSSEQWIASANNFERIAQKEKTEWLPPYYAAYSLSMAFYMEPDAAKREPLVEKVDQWIARADSLSPDNAEIYVVKNMASTLHININPMVNGQKYGPLASMQLEKAKKLDPENPRVYMREGLSLYFTPAQWGGDKAKGKVPYSPPSIRSISPRALYS